MKEKENPRDRVIRLVEEGIVSYETMLIAAIQYMSSDDVAEMLDMNELSERFFEDEDEDEDED